MRSRDLSAGRFFTAEARVRSERGRARSETPRELFTAANPVGQTVMVYGTALTVIGVLEPSGATSDDGNEDDLAVVPITTAQRVLRRDQHGGLHRLRRGGRRPTC